MRRVCVVWLSATAGLLLAVLAAGAGCATLAALRPLPRACEGPIVPIAAMGPDFALQARYRATSGGRSEALLLVAEKRGDRLVLAGVDPLGHLVFALTQTGADVRRDRHVRALFPFAPENALRDLERVRFPAAAAAAGPARDEARVERRDGLHRIARPSCEWEATLAILP